ncbi:MAG TPA: SIS domain-containing protein [Chitinophagaceae bacterium]|nr:SIS domain-containing protein [Chitinophagaceae bacterium]
MRDYLEKYLSEQKAALESIPLAAVEYLINDFKKALKEDRQIFVFGNGGSASNASHFVTDLGKSASDKTYRRFRCISLNENLSWITAIGNDYAYEDIFIRQLENYARKDDMVMVLSVSGNSPNLVKAIEWCKQNGIYSIALLGGQKGKLAGLADKSVIIDSTHYGRVEDCQMHICHMICYAFIENKELQQS